MHEVIFEWDPEKAERNLRKHGVAFEEAITVFGDPGFCVAYDEQHSLQEPRQKLVGVSEKSRMLAVIFTRRGLAVRIISVRRATAREAREYGEAQDQS